MADRPRPDIIASRHDPDRRRSAPWRLLVGTAAVALIASGVGVQHLLDGSGSRPRHNVHSALSSLRLTAPQMLHGTALRRGEASGAVLFLGGEELRRLTIVDRASSPLSDVQLSIGDGGGQLGPGPAVQQVSSVAGGVVALVTGVGSAGLRDLGDVVFIPASATGAGDPRVLARADYMAVAPNHRDIWVEQAGPPWGNGPAESPAWLIDEAGHRLSTVTRLPGKVLDAATVRGLLVQQASGDSALIDPASGAAERDGIARGALIVDADADQVAWQPQSCKATCPLHITSLHSAQGAGQRRQGAGQSGQGAGQSAQAAVIPLPARTSVDVADTADFDPAGQRLALPLDTVNRHGVATGTYVYVADIGDRKLIRIPGGPIPLVSLPAVMGAIPAGSTDVVAVRWAADDSGMWIVATDGLYFQVAYWPGTGSLQVLSPQSGLADKFDVPGPGAPSQ